MVNTSAPNDEVKLPPIQVTSVLALGCVLAGGIDMAAHIPQSVSLVVPVILLCVAGAIVVGNLAVLSRVRSFAWKRFFLVTRWTLLVYLVIAGMIEYVFVYDGTRGNTLVVLTAMLVVFAVNIPVLLGFSVARFADPEGGTEGASAS